MEARFAQLYHCLEGARDNAADWRELVCALRVLDNPAKIAKRAREMLQQESEDGARKRRQKRNQSTKRGFGAHTKNEFKRAHGRSKTKKF